MMLKALRPFLKLGHFKGKTRVEAFMTRVLWRPEQLPVGRGLVMELDPEEWIQFQYIKGDLLEPGTLDLIERLLKPGDVFIDVGSHVGLETLVARTQVGESGHVIAIEPQPYNAAKILTNWRINGFTNLKLYVAAAGEKTRRAWLEEQDPSDRALLSLGHTSKRSLGLAFATPVVTLEEVIAEQGHENVKLLKIDVEGFELRVLKGLGSPIRGVENIIFEHLPARDGEAKSGAITYLESCGFEFRTVTGKRWRRGEEVPENNLWVRPTGEGAEHA